MPRRFIIINENKHLSLGKKDDMKSYQYRKEREDGPKRPALSQIGLRNQWKMSVSLMGAVLFSVFD
ncbi:hypothetical protein SAMN05421736_10856 [Evansella caseinilytica]|uniref:Uncharacterized protein n=1 Tax=Evansella caseinilytica TaxID=1503961 RepID=A0A1H3RD79_9BACI|nr:hypothetical protein SAMN05421736_10856 [Evansella caseinilytica]